MRRWRTLAELCLVLALGCGGGRLLLPDPPRGVDYEELSARAPLRPGENIRAVEIRRAEHSSTHLVQIRDRETPHIHTVYDLTVLLVGGKGTLWLAGRPLTMREGDTAVIPKGVPHWFENTGTNPAAALVTFAPPFSGPDQAPCGTEDRPASP